MTKQEHEDLARENIGAAMSAGMNMGRRPVPVYPVRKVERFERRKPRGRA